MNATCSRKSRTHFWGIIQQKEVQNKNQRGTLIQNVFGSIWSVKETRQNRPQGCITMILWYAPQIMFAHRKVLGNELSRYPHHPIGYQIHEALPYNGTWILRHIVWQHKWQYITGYFPRKLDRPVTMADQMFQFCSTTSRQRPYYKFQDFTNWMNKDNIIPNICGWKLVFWKK